MEPNKERLRLWVEDLRSGEYKPNRKGELRNGTGTRYCCLGVACATYLSEGNPGQWDSDGYFLDESGERLEGAFLPQRVSDWFGLGASDPHLLSKSKKGERATILNDSRKYSFAQIADAIERTFNLTEP